MDSQPKKPSKEAIAHRVIGLREKGFGCWTNAAIQRSEGTDTSKDNVVPARAIIGDDGLGVGHARTADAELLT